MTAVAYQLLTATSAAASSALAENGVVTGADYASIFRNARTFENLGLPAVDGSSDDGRIRSALIDIVDAIDASAAERLRNRAASERAGHGLMLLRLDEVDTGAAGATSASEDFAAAVAANSVFTNGTVTETSTADEIDAIAELTAADLLQARADLETEEAQATPDSAVTAELTAKIALLEAETVLLDELSTLATANETAETGFLGAIFDFFNSLVSFFVDLFTGGKGLDDVDPNDLLRAGGPIDQAFEQLSQGARSADSKNLTTMLESIDRRELLMQVREELRAARAEGRTSVDLGPLIMQFALRSTVEMSEGPAPSPIRVPDMRTAALEPRRPGSNAPVQPNGPTPSQQLRAGGAGADGDAGLFPTIPEAVFSVPGLRPSDAPIRSAPPVSVGAGVAAADAAEAAKGETDAGLLGFDARDGRVVVDPLLFDTVERGIFSADELSSVLAEFGEEPFARADRALPAGIDAATRRRVAASFAALIENAIAISDAAEEAAVRRSEDARTESRRVRLEL